MSQNESAKSKGQKHAKLMLVRYGRMGGMGWFEHHEADISKLNAYVVVKTERGMELGQIVGLHNYRGGQFKSSPEQVEAYYVNRTKDFPLGEGGSFVRFATHEDIREQEHLEKSAIGHECKILNDFVRISCFSNIHWNIISRSYFIEFLINNLCLKVSQSINYNFETGTIGVDSTIRIIKQLI